MRNGYYTPCRKCHLCLSKEASSWAFRVEQEAINSNYVYNVLLTYNPESVPLIDGQMTLDKQHLSAFMKRLRDRLYRKWQARLRFFSAGEYGGNTNRPHYHMIIFSDKDLRALADGKRYNLSSVFKEFTEAWSFGNVSVSRYNGEVGKFTRYMTQYLFILDDKRYGKIRKPFRHMSRRPAIGASWLDNPDNKRIIRKMIDTDKYEVYRGNIVDKTTGKERALYTPLPSYYRKKIQPIDKQEAQKNKFYQHGIDYAEYKHYLFENGKSEEFRKQCERARELGKQHQREQYRARKVHHTNLDTSGFLEKSACEW